MYIRVNETYSKDKWNIKWGKILYQQFKEKYCLKMEVNKYK